MKARKEAAHLAIQQGNPDLPDLQPSPSVVKREKEKITKYAFLTTMEQRQVADQKRRPFHPRRRNA